MLKSHQTTQPTLMKLGLKFVWCINWELGTSIVASVDITLSSGLPASNLSILAKFTACFYSDFDVDECSRITFCEPIDTTTSFVDTVSKLAKEVGEAFKEIPYIKAVAGTIIQIIAIKDDIRTAKERLHELVNKVVWRSNVILEGLLSVAASPHKNVLVQGEGKLKEYHNLLIKILRVLQVGKAKSMFDHVVNRKSRLDDLEKYNRLLEDYNANFLTGLVLQLNIHGLPQQSTPSVVPDLPFVYKSVLPQRPELMIGRDEEKFQVIDTLLHKSPPRIAILGAGGMGKTTLALSVLHNPEIVDRYSSRYFISCEETPTKLSVIIEIVNTLRIPREIRDACLLDSILAGFPENSLLCLDNLETFWDNEAVRVDLEELLSDLQLPNLGLMITRRGTQRPSRVSWSKPFLPPLESLPEESSRRIFERKFSRPADEFEEKLLVAVNRIPLAISLVCAMLEEGNETSKSLWNRWEETQSKALGNGGKDRLSNLDTFIRLSVDGPRMRAEPRVVDILAMMSFLPDGLPDNKTVREELQHHLPAGYDVSEALITMRRASLVHLDKTGESDRFRMLNPVRNFCEQKLHFPEELKSSLTSLYVAILDKFKDCIAPEGYTMIPGQIHNAHAVLKQG
ncbi:hypothetical protein H0H87_009285 [Tephrocybe sp. NHM501043]|nr:hypothetical protein H0H87_009285 [Tephrocybe sp. NHM501043]